MFIKLDKQYLDEYALSLAITAGSIAALNCPWESVKILGLTILTGVGFEFINHYQASRVCIEYFTLDHVYHGKKLENRLVKSLNPFLNAAVLSIGCGYSYTIPAIALSFFSRKTFPRLTTLIAAKQLAPYLISTAIVATIFGEIFSRYFKQKLESKMLRQPNYAHYRDIPEEFQSSWEACNKRFETGRALLRLSWVVVAAVLLANRAGLIDRSLVVAILKENIAKLNFQSYNFLK